MAVRDKEWLTLEACREFQRGTCSRTDQECKYAHPSNSVVVENGRVIACYDSMKGQCTRENCRYLHPPPHLKTQLEIKGQNNIAARRMLQNAALQNQLLAAQPGSAIPIQPTILSSVPTSIPSGTSPVAATTSQANLEVNPAAAAAYYYHGHHPYMIPAAVSMAPTMSHSTFNQHMYPASYLSQAVQTLPAVAPSTTVPGTGTNVHPGFSEIPFHQAPFIPTAPGAPFQIFPVKAKNDRLEYHVKPAPVAPMTGVPALGVAPDAMKKVCREFQRGNCSRGEIECKFAHPEEHLIVDSTDNTVTVCMDYVKGRCTREKCKYFHPPAHLQAKIKTVQQQHLALPDQPSPPHIAAVLPTTNRKRPREEDDQLLLMYNYLKDDPARWQSSSDYSNYLQMWNYLKDDQARWQSSSDYSNYLQNHQSLSACLPRPAKMPATFPPPQMAQSPIYPSNLLYNPLGQMTVMAQPQFLPAPLPMMPHSFPFLAPHILHNQNTSESLPVCRDFKSGNCKRPNCKYAHVMEDYVEITDGKVTVCRYAVQNRCTRPRCKFYHPPPTGPIAMVNSIPHMPTPGVTHA